MAGNKRYSKKNNRKSNKRKGTKRRRRHRGGSEVLFLENKLNDTTNTNSSRRTKAKAKAKKTSLNLKRPKTTSTNTDSNSNNGSIIRLGRKTKSRTSKDSNKGIKGMTPEQIEKMLRSLEPNEVTNMLIGMNSDDIAKIAPILTKLQKNKPKNESHPEHQITEGMVNYAHEHVKSIGNKYPSLPRTPGLNVVNQSQNLIDAVKKHGYNAILNKGTLNALNLKSNMKGPGKLNSRFLKMFSTEGEGPVGLPMRNKRLNFRGRPTQSESRKRRSTKTTTGLLKLPSNKKIKSSNVEMLQYNNGGTKLIGQTYAGGASKRKMQKNKKSSK